MRDSTFSHGSTTRLIDVVQLVATDYTIKDVDPRVKDWEGSYGPMKSYTVTFDTGQEVEVNQKPSTAPPTVGQVLHGVIEEGKFGLKFKKVVKQGAAAGSWSPKKDDPDQRRSIERQVSAKITADLVIAGKAELKDFRTLTDRVHAAIEGKAGE